jgi:hypothetical protein
LAVARQKAEKIQGEKLWFLMGRTFISFSESSTFSPGVTLRPSENETNPPSNSSDFVPLLERESVAFALEIILPVVRSQLQLREK